MMDELAVAVNYNPHTGKILATPFKGPGCHKMASAFCLSLKDEGGEWADCIWGVLASESAVTDRLQSIFGIIRKTLQTLKIGVVKRFLSGNIVLYREPIPRFKRDGNPKKTVVTPWLDMTTEQARCLAAAILLTIDVSEGQVCTIAAGSGR